jgi:PKD repeat protein
MRTRIFRLTGVTFIALSAACGVHQAETPAISGPSTLATSVSVTATPDHITYLSADGSSQPSTIVVTVHGPNGQPSVGTSIRLDMLVGGTLEDYGTLSARTVTTGNDGTAKSIYTAPAAPPPPANTTSSSVQIQATVLGSDATTTTPVTAAIVLVPAGVILPPADTPTPSFQFNPSSPTTNAPTLFDASASCPGAATNGVCAVTTSTIASYSWAFGDGAIGTGQTATHSYLTAATFTVTLTVTNSRGVAASVSKSVTLGALGIPTAAFVFSPTAPTVGTSIVFNADSSAAAVGHSIVQFNWNFGDGAVASGSLASHTFTVAGTYNVALSVLDDAGQKGTTSQAVSVTAAAGGIAGAPSANFTSSPTQPFVGEDVVFDSSSSAASPGRTLVDYAWNFGDSTPIVHGTQRIIDHTYSVPGTFIVNLVLTDDQGATGQRSANVVVTSGNPTAVLSVFKTGGNAVQGDGSASTSTGTSTITNYTFFWGDGQSTSGSGSAASHTYGSVGTYTVTLRVTDSQNRVGTSPAQTVTVP